MQFDIVHRTIYRYARPVEIQPHRLLLYPRNSPELRVLASSLHCTPAAEFTWTQDVFGNLVARQILRERLLNSSSPAR